MSKLLVMKKPRKDHPETKYESFFMYFTKEHVSTAQFGQGEDLDITATPAGIMITKKAIVPEQPLEEPAT